MTNAASSNIRFPIRILSERTGVGCSTLRAWERRFQLLNPDRTPKGHRLYSDDDVNRVNTILMLLNDGHNLPAITEYLNNIKNSSDTNRQDSLEIQESENNWIRLQSETIDSVEIFNIEQIDRVYNEALSHYPVEQVLANLIEPVLNELGDRWQSMPERGVAEEHFFSNWLINRLGARFHHHYSQARGPKIICACTPNNFHTIGLMIFSISALARGYRVLYFGANLPLHQIPHIINRSAAKGLILSLHPFIPEPGQSIEPIYSFISGINIPTMIGGENKALDIDRAEQSGAILLGKGISIALKILEDNVPIK